MNEYQKAALEARGKVSKLTLDQEKQLLKLYEDSAQSLIQKASKAKDKSLTKRWLLDYSKEINRVKSELSYKIEGMTVSAIDTAAKIGVDTQRGVLKSILASANIDVGDHFTSMFSQVQKQAIKDIISGGLYKDNKTLSKRVWGASESFKNDIQYIVNRGIIEKKSARDLAKGLEKYVIDPTSRGPGWAKKYPKLKMKRASYSAQRLSRTAINHSYQTSTIKSSSMNPYVEGILWQSALIHGRTCEICRERHGMIFDVNNVPLDHPNGLCTMLPHIPKDSEDIAAELNKWLNGESNQVLDNWYDKHGKHFGFSERVHKPRKNDIIRKKDRYKTTKEAYKKVSYRSIDKEYSALIDDRFLDLQNKYPINEGNIEIKALSKNKVFGYSKGQIIDKKGTLYYVDEIVISNKTMKDASISNRLHERNYISRGSKLRNGLSTIDHEYAHAIDNYYIYKTDSYAAKTIDMYREGVLFRGTLEHLQEANKFNKHMYSSKNSMSYEIYNRMKSELNINNIEMNKLISKELGSYAASSKSEFLAEGFANIRYLGENDKTEFIKLFESTFNTIFDEVIR